jgi:hypothetical protein
LETELPKLVKNKEMRRQRKFRLSWAEVLTIMMYYPHSGYKTFKDYYTKHVLFYLDHAFPGRLVSYNRFVELQQMAMLPMFIFSRLACVTCDGFSYIDSTALEVCHIRRAYSHKVFNGSARKGRTTTGWFFGFKLHLIINQHGELVNFDLTPGNIADNNAPLLLRLIKQVFGKLYGDKGYLLAESVFRDLFEKGVQVVTKVRSNMKNRFLLWEDKMRLNSRGMIESCINVLKSRLSLEHSRHRSPTNFLSHIFTVLAAYSFIEEKPSINAFKPVLLLN